MAVRARKRFGQNFLHDVVVLERIQAVVNPQPHEWILEIGPGHGALTQYLHGYCERLQAVEIDRDLIAGLRAKFAGLELTNADILRVDFAALLAGDATHPPPAWRVVGNLPYNLSTPLLGRLLAQQALIQDMHFMLQKEVAERLAATPSTKAWGRLSVMIQYQCDVEILIDVPPEAFTPAPAVQSWIVRITPKQTLAGSPELTAALEQTVALAFQQRRKRLSNALKPLALDFHPLPVDPGARPDQLGVQDYLAIAEQLLERGRQVLKG